MKFYLGTHRPTWLGRVDFPLFVSRNTLPWRKLPRARAAWAMDSGGFTEITQHGRWRTSAKDYAAEVRRVAEEVGSLDFAAPQDMMCEPIALKASGLTVREHQVRTVENFLELRAIAPDLPIIPVVQGWETVDYLRCAEMYAAHGVDLTLEPTVGVGSVCRRQSEIEAVDIFTELAGVGISCHGFGVKTGGLRRYGHLLASADSMAWSYRGRRLPPLPDCVGHKNCANCLTWACAWRDQLLARLDTVGVR